MKSYGFGKLPERFNRSEGRLEAERLTGSNAVPVLVTDDGEIISDSKRIIAWARAHPATSAPGAAGTAS